MSFPEQELFSAAALLAKLEIADEMDVPVSQRNTRPLESKPFTQLALPEILRYVELNTRRTWAKRIPEIRYGFQKSRPAPIKKVVLGCTDDSRPNNQWPGYMFVIIDGVEIRQMLEQSDEEFFDVIRRKVFRKEHRIVDLCLQSNCSGWLEERFAKAVFSEMPTVRNFELDGAVHSDASFFHGMRPVEAKCRVGTSIMLYPMRTARVLSFIHMVGNDTTMGFLTNCLATKWDVSVTLANGYEDDWVFEKFASGVMEVDSVYQVGRRDASHEPFIKRMVQKYPLMARIEEEDGKVKYVLDLANGTRVMSWVAERRPGDEIMNIKIVTN